MGIVISILLLSFLVLIHELGHFLAAKWAKVRVEEFGLGYPPRALSLFTKWGTLFSLNWIPFGGFVRMEGEDEDLSPAETAQNQRSATAFYSQPAGKRLVIILAGAAINFIFGIIAFSVVYSVSGIPTEWDVPRIIAVQTNSPAAQVQLPTNVNVTEIKVGEQSQLITSREQVIELIAAHKGETIGLVTTGPCREFECQELSQEFSLRVRTDEEIPVGQGAVGIIFQTSYPKFYPWYEMPFRGMVLGVVQALGVGIFIVQSFISLVLQGIQQGAVPAELMSPVGIVDEIGRSGVVQEGVLAVLYLAGMISVNLAILNVMPIPALDGGRAAFIVLGQVIKTRYLSKIEGYVNYAGLILLVLLLLFLSVRDIYNILVRFLAR